MFAYPLSKVGKEFKYVKLTGHCNSTYKWDYISELKVYGYRHPNPTFYENQIVKTYPYPASKIINIIIDEPTLSPDHIRIINLLGKIVFQNNLAPENRKFQIPINFQNRVFILQMGPGELTPIIQKLIIAFE